MLICFLLRWRNFFFMKKSKVHLYFVLEFFCECFLCRNSVISAQKFIFLTEANIKKNILFMNYVKLPDFYY